MNKMTPQERYAGFGALVSSVPTFAAYPLAKDDLLWLGRLSAYLSDMGAIADLVKLNALSSSVATPLGGKRQIAADGIRLILYRGFAAAEAQAPAASKGAFIPAGNAFDAVTVVSRVLQTASSNVLFVDPYMDEKTLVTFAIMGREGVTVRLLTDKGGRHPSLQPAAEAWVAQYGSARELQLRFAPKKALHDRLIIVDDKEAFTLTQSLNAFAARSPASVLRADAETAALKVDAYADLWSRAEVVIG